MLILCFCRVAIKSSDDIDGEKTPVAPIDNVIIAVPANGKI